MKQAVILAGGKGTRLRSRTGDLPKALVDVCGMPLLGRQLQLLRDQGFQEVVVMVSYGAQSIRDYCRSIASANFQIRFIEDAEPRGTAGAILISLAEFESQFLVLYGDTMLNVDLTRFWDWHTSDPAAAASLFLHPNDHPCDSDLVEIDEQSRIVCFHPYPHPDNIYLSNLVNAALYVINRDSLAEYIDLRFPLDLAKDLFPEILASGRTLRGYVSTEYIKDAGTPERLDKVCRDHTNQVIARASLRVKQKAVLVDRDGTLNEENGYITSPEQLHVFYFVGPALRRLNESGWRAVVITNQPVLARGEASALDLRKVHAKLESEVALSQAFFDRIYHCPHHPDRGYPGEVSSLKVECDCRKPAPGLIHRAASDLNLDLSQSWFIGDSAADMQAAAAAGVRSILVSTGVPDSMKMGPIGADYRMADFKEAVEFILDIYPGLVKACSSLIDLLRPGSNWFISGTVEKNVSLIVSTLIKELKGRGVRCALKRAELRSAETSSVRDSFDQDHVTFWTGRDARSIARHSGLEGQTIDVVATQQRDAKVVDSSRSMPARYVIDVGAVMNDLASHMVFS